MSIDRAYSRRTVRRADGPDTMLIHLLKSKIHRAQVTGASVDYEGSLTIAQDLMEKVGFLPFERVLCSNLANGERFETYVIPGEAGSGTICINGAAAHLVHPGDLIIICAYAQFEERELADFRPLVVHVDEGNRQK